MTESHLIETESSRNATYYRMTDSDGRLWISSKKRSPGHPPDIDSYLTEHAYEMRNESSIAADYYRTPGQEYAAHCSVKEGKTTLIDLTVTVSHRRSRPDSLRQLKKKSQEVYAAVMKLLM